MSKKIFCIFALFSLSLPLSSFPQEPLSIVTYYSSPNGAYERLSTQSAAVRVLGVGDTNGDSNFDMGDAPNFSTQSGQAWISAAMGIGIVGTLEPLNVSWDSSGTDRSIAIFESGPRAPNVGLYVRQDASRSRIELQVLPIGAGVERHLIFNKNGGEVGILNDNPASGLDIEGSLDISGELQIKGNSLAACPGNPDAIGLIKFDGSTFWGCNGVTPWKDLYL